MGSNSFSPTSSSSWQPGFYDPNNFRELGMQEYNWPTWKKEVAKAMAQNVASGVSAGYPAGWDFDTLGTWDAYVGSGEYVSAGLITKISTYLDSYQPGTSEWIDTNFPMPSRSDNDFIEGPDAFAFRIQQEGEAEDRALDREQQEFQQAKFFIELAANSSAASLRASSGGGGSVPGVVRTTSSGGGGGGSSDTTYRYSESVNRSYSDPAELALRKAISDAEIALAQGRLDLDRANAEVDRLYKQALTENLAAESRRQDEELKLRRAETFSKIAANPSDAVQREYFLRLGQSPTGTPTDVFTGQVSGAPTTLPQLMEQQAPLLQPYAQSGTTGLPPVPSPENVNPTPEVPQVPQVPQVPAAAQGTYGYVNDQRMVVGDSLDGRPNEELIENPTGAPIKVVPLSAMARGTRMPKYATGTLSAMNLPGYTSVASIRAKQESGVTPQIESGVANADAYQSWLDAGSPELTTAADYRNAGWQYSSGGFIDPATGLDANQRTAVSNLAASNAAKEELPFYYGEDTRMDAGTAYKQGLVHAGQQIFNGQLVDLWIDPKSGMLYRFDGAGNKFSVTDTTPLGSYNPVFNASGKLSGLGNFVTQDYTNIGPKGFPTGSGAPEIPYGNDSILNGVPQGSLGPSIGQPIQGFRPVMSGGQYTTPDGGGRITLQQGDYLGPDGTVYRWNSVIGKHDVVPYIPTEITTPAQFYALDPDVQRKILRGEPTGYFVALDLSGALNDGSMGPSTDPGIGYDQFRALPQQTLRDLAEGVYARESIDPRGRATYTTDTESARLGLRPRQYATSNLSSNYSIPTPAGNRPTGLMVAPRLGEEQYDYVDFNPYFEQFSEQDWGNLYPQTVSTNPPNESDMRSQVLENIGLGDFDIEGAQQANPPGSSIPITMANQPEHFRMIVDPYTGNVYVSQDWGVTWFNKGKPNYREGQLAGSGSLWDTVNRVITAASGGQWGLLNTPQGYALGTRVGSRTSPFSSTPTAPTAPTSSTPLSLEAWYKQNYPGSNPVNATKQQAQYNTYLSTFGQTPTPTVPAPTPTTPTVPPAPTAPVPPLPPLPTTPLPTPTTPTAPANPVFQPSTEPATSSPSLSAIQYDNTVYQNLPVLQLASGQIPLSAYAQLGNQPTPIPALGGTVLPSPAQGNWTTLNYLAENSPASYALLSSLYAAGNRDLDSEMATVRANAPRGQAYIPSLIQT